MANITSSIGVTDANDLPNALWIGELGYIAAQEFGHTLEKSLPGLLINGAENKLQSAYYDQSQKNLQDNAVLCL